MESAEQEKEEVQAQTSQERYVYACIHATKLAYKHILTVSAPAAKSEEISTPVEAIRFSTRQKPQTQYNEEEYDIYGLEPEDEEVLTPNDQGAAEEDEGDVIEMVLDHRRLHGTGTWLRRHCFIKPYSTHAHTHAHTFPTHLTPFP